MSAQKGRDLLMKVEDTPGSGTFSVVGGLRATSFSLNNELIDTTHKGSAGKRTLLEGAGIQSMSLSGSGLFEDDAPFAQVRSAAESNQHLKFQIIMPGSSDRTYEGTFMITRLDYSGDYNGEVAYSLALESSGAISSM